MCRVLGVSASGYYAWRSARRRRERTADAALCCGRSARSTSASRGTYGVPRVHAELRDARRPRRPQAGRSADARGGLGGREPAQALHDDDVRDRDARPAPDLVERNFAAPGPEPALGRRHHVHPDVGRLPLPGRRPRCVEPARRRLGDGDAPAHRARARRARHGARAAAAERRHPSLRSGLPVHVDRLRRGAAS